MTIFLPRVNAVVQARMSSTRLPNKMLLNLHGYPVVEWIFRRTSQSRLLHTLIFAVPDTPSDDVLAFHLERIGAKVIRGDEQDVVSRYITALKAYPCDYLVRICADNPLVCPVEIDRLIDFFHKTQPDYAYNHIPRDNLYPDGLGAEICTSALIHSIDRIATAKAHREHIFNYVWDNLNDYSIATLDPPASLRAPSLKLDLDTYSDYQFLMQAPLHIKISSHEIVASLKNK